MRYSTSFLPTAKQSSKDVDCISHDLTIRAGLAMQVAAGHYAFLPIGSRVLNKVESIIREEMNSAGAIEIRMPIMQPSTLWEESGRWDIYGQLMFKLKNRSSRDFCLAPTHEEQVVSLVRAQLQSYKELPFTLYQIGVKFRDELRARGGLLRAKEFLMKDAYSFDLTDERASDSYAKMRQAYIRIFKRTGINAIPISASPGEIGGSFSEEFIAEAAAGEDKFVIDTDGRAHKLESVDEPAAKPMDDVKDVRTGIEVGHIFKLGTRYSDPDAMNLCYTDSDGRLIPAVMGCYGIGVSRIISAVIEQNHDEKGIVWPQELRPFDVCIVPIRYDETLVRKHSDSIYNALLALGVNVLLDDRDVSPGVKFKDADLIGIPYKLIVGSKGITEGSIECEERATGHKHMLPLDNIEGSFQSLLHSVRMLASANS